MGNDGSCNTLSKIIVRKLQTEGYLNSLDWSGGLERWTGLLDWTTGALDPTASSVRIDICAISVYNSAKHAA